VLFCFLQQQLFKYWTGIYGFCGSGDKNDMCKVSPSVEGKETAVIYRGIMMPALDKILAVPIRVRGNYRLGDENARLKDYVTKTTRRLSLLRPETL
jgi:hypothetical protein